MLVILYIVFFVALLGGSFAMMWVNVRSIMYLMDNPAPRTRHPEAPKPGEEVMYVNLEREKLEKLFDE